MEEGHVKNEERKDKSIDYNCTVKTTKPYARLMFNGQSKCY